MDEQQNEFQQEETFHETNSDLDFFNGNTTESSHPQLTTNEQSLLKAILLSCAFGLVGALVFGILYYLQVIAFIGAYLTFFLACLGYKKFNNNTIDKKGYLITTVIAIIEILFAIVIANAAYIMNALPEFELSFFQALSLIPELLANDFEFKAALMSDIIISIIFVFVGLISDISLAKKRARRGY